MKKTIYLQNENWTKDSFEFENIEDLKEQLDLRKVSLGLRLTIGNRASIGYAASIGDDASIGNAASIGNDASIGNRASIGNDVKLVRTFFLTGSRHSVTFTGNGTLSIGCHNYSIEKWLEKFNVIGEKENYSENEILEYKGYIELAKVFNDNLPKTY